MLLNELNKLGLSIDDLPKLKIDVTKVPKDDVDANYLKNYALKSSPDDLPIMCSYDEVYPDFAVLERERWLYGYTEKTLLTFLEEDDEFLKEGLNLYKAIIEKDELTLRYFKYKYRNIHFFSPLDISIYGKEDRYVVLNRLAMISITFIWFALEMDGVTLPLLTWGNENTFPYCFENIAYGSNVLVSLKGSMKKIYNKKVAMKAIDYFINTKMPKTIVVVSDGNDENTKLYFSTANRLGIKVIYLDNTLKQRNVGGAHNG